MSESKDRNAGGSGRRRYEGESGAALGVSAGENQADPEATLLAELRLRRQRLARWMQLLEEEVMQEIATARKRSGWHRCHSRATRP
jgi:hypothetical protein